MSKKRKPLGYLGVAKVDGVIVAVIRGSKWSKRVEVKV